MPNFIRRRTRRGTARRPPAECGRVAPPRASPRKRVPADPQRQEDATRRDGTAAYVGPIGQWIHIQRHASLREGLRGV